MRSPKSNLAAVFCLSLLSLVNSPAFAGPYAAPGDTALRVDLEYLVDTGTINIPLATWPVSLGDVDRALEGAASDNEQLAITLRRIRERVRWESALNSWRFDFGLSLAENPRVVRTFEDTPRPEAQAFARLQFVGERFVMNLEGRAVADPVDGDEFRPDGTYVGVALGNWMLSAGWQERWWGPGNASSLILSNNARPRPGVGLQRNGTQAFNTKWLSWLGPWSFTTFMDWLDDEREIEDALLFGARFSFRPVSGLEIGLSRTAQWCGEGRPCDFSTFLNLLVGNDNRDVNVDPEDEPGNQLAGIDIRWTLPRQIPLAVYVQWIGEDGRQGTALPGSWLRQAGIEYWGNIGGSRHKTYFEVSDTACHDGGLGSADVQPNCAYNHEIYRTGYRYGGAAIGHSTDGDSQSYSLGSTLVQTDGHSWNFLVRQLEINRVGDPDSRHTLSATPLSVSDVQVSHERVTSFGTFRVGAGYTRSEEFDGVTSSNGSAFVQWSSR